MGYILLLDKAGKYYPSTNGLGEVGAAAVLGGVMFAIVRRFARALSFCFSYFLTTFFVVVVVVLSVAHRQSSGDEQRHCAADVPLVGDAAAHRRAVWRLPRDALLIVRRISDPYYNIGSWGREQDRYDELLLYAQKKSQVAAELADEGVKFDGNLYDRIFTYEKIVDQLPTDEYGRPDPRLRALAQSRLFPDKEPIMDPFDPNARVPTPQEADLLEDDVDDDDDVLDDEPDDDVLDLIPELEEFLDQEENREASKFVIGDTSKIVDDE